MAKLNDLKTLKGLITLFLLVLLISEGNAQNEVAIGSTTTKSNAILWLNGNGSQGLILPIVSNKTAVSSPDKGMIVYDNSDNKVWYRNDNAWVEVGGGSTVADNDKLSLQIQGNQLQLLDGTKVQSTVNIAGGTAISGAFMIWTGTSWQYTTLSDVSGATGQVTGIKGKSVPNLPTTPQALVYDGTAWTFQSITTGGTDSQDLSLNTTTNSLSLTNDATPVDLTPYKQNLTLDASNNLGITGGNTVTLPAAVTRVDTGTGLTGGPITTTGTINVDVGTGPNKIVQLDATGKLPAVDGSQLTNLPPLVEIGDISNVTTTAPITGGGTSGSVTIGLANSGITPGIYGSATAVPQMTVDAFGRITAITTFPPLVADGSVTGGPAGAGVKIAANTITDANILSLNASKITAGTLPVAQVPNLDASKITTGTFNTSQIPNLDASKITTGIIPTTQGGTGLNLSPGSIGNGQLLIGNNAGFTKANLTAGSGINITDGAGSITISSTATVTNVSGTPPINVINGTTTPVISLANTAVTPNTYGTTVTIPQITVDAQGRITAANNQTIPTANATTTGLLSNTDWNTFNSKGSGTVTSVATGTGLTGGPITNSGTISLTNTGVTAATYGTALTIPQIAVDLQGRITSANNQTIPTANTTTSGLLSNTDWNTFNAKQGALTLTTTGASGPATLSGNTLNIPQYTSSSYLAGTGLTLTGSTFSVNTSQNISTLSNLTANGLIKTSGGTGALSIATAGTDYLVTETDPAVKAINGIVKSNGTTLSAAAAGTDYVAPNAAITGATATKITYDAKGLVTAGTSLVAGDIPNIAESQVTNLVTDLAGKQPLLNGTGFIKATGTTITYDNSTYLTSFTETDPAVKAINGIVKSNGTTLSAAAAGTDYVAPNAAITGATATKITYDAKGLVTAGTSLVAGDIPNIAESQVTNLVTDLAGKQPQLNGTGLVRASGTTITYDNATYLSSETDPVVTAINGIVKSNGITLSAAAAGTDYVAPTTIAGGDLSGTFSDLQLVAGTIVDADISGTAAIAGTKITPSFGAQNISTTGTLTTGNSTTFGTATTTWPAANAAGVLTNDGNGALSWAASGGSGWSLTGNDISATPTNFIGTTSNNDLIFKTNNTQALKIGSNGKISTLSNPVSPTAVLPELEIYQGGAESTQLRVVGAPGQLQTLQLWGQNTSTDIKGWSVMRNSDDTFVITRNVLTDINAAPPSTHAMIIETNGNVLIGPDRPANSKLDIEGNLAVGAAYAGTGGTAAPTNGAIIQGNVGIGTNAPSTNLHVVGSIRMVDGNQAAGRVLTSDANGVASWQAAGAGSGWTLIGNSGLSATTNFIGTTDNVRFNFRVNNQNAGRIDVDGSGGNVALGALALNSISTGTDNVAIGNRALTASTQSLNNVAVGRGALFTQGATNTLGSNTAIGSQALYQNTTGYRNTAIGYLAGATTTNPDVVGVGITTGNSNTFIGSGAGPLTTNSISNSSAIGANAKVTNPNTMVFGSTGVKGWGFGAQPATCCDAILVGTDGTNGNGATLSLAGDWLSTSDSTKKYNVNTIQYGLEEIMKLKPVNYQWKGTGEKDFGFLAQQVKTILPETVHGEEGHMTLSYGHITAVLTKAMQEQQKEIEELKARLQEKDNKVNSLESSVTSMKNELEEIKRALGMEAKAASKDKKVNE